jgi:hypothetical protein
MRRSGRLREPTLPDLGARRLRRLSRSLDRARDAQLERRGRRAGVQALGHHVFQRRRCAGSAAPRSGTGRPAPSELRDGAATRRPRTSTSRRSRPGAAGCRRRKGGVRAAAELVDLRPAGGRVEREVAAPQQRRLGQEPPGDETRRSPRSARPRVAARCRSPAARPVHPPPRCRDAAGCRARAAARRRGPGGRAGAGLDHRHGADAGVAAGQDRREGDTSSVPRITGRRKGACPLR